MLVAHTLTGHHPAQEQWKKIAEVVGRKKLCWSLTARIRGSAVEDTDADAGAIRYFYFMFFTVLLDYRSHPRDPKRTWSN